MWMWCEANRFIIDTLTGSNNNKGHDDESALPRDAVDFIDDLVYLIENPPPFLQHRIPELFKRLSMKWYISYDLVVRFIDREWDWSFLSRNYAINIIDIVNNPQHPWDYNEVSSHPGLTWDVVAKYSHLPWDYTALSSHPCITWDIVCANPHIKWDRDGLDVNPNITEDIVKNNMDSAWFNNRNTEFLVYFSLKDKSDNDIGLIYFRNLLTQTPENHDWSRQTLRLIKEYPNGPLDWLKISERIVIDESTMEQYMDYKWNWIVMSKHFSLDFYLKHKDEKPWEWRLISANPNITWTDIRKNPDLKWSVNELLGNWMLQPRKRYDYGLYYSAHRQEKTKQFVGKIEEELLVCAWHPCRVVDWCLSIDEKINGDGQA